MALIVWGMEWLRLSHEKWNGWGCHNRELSCSLTAWRLFFLLLLYHFKASWLLCAAETEELPSLLSLLQCPDCWQDGVSSLFPSVIIYFFSFICKQYHCLLIYLMAFLNGHQEELTWCLPVLLLFICPYCLYGCVQEKQNSFQWNPKLSQSCWFWLLSFTLNQGQAII